MRLSGLLRFFTLCFPHFPRWAVLSWLVFPFLLYTQMLCVKMKEVDTWFASQSSITHPHKDFALGIAAGIVLFLCLAAEEFHRKESWRLRLFNSISSLPPILLLPKGKHMFFKFNFFLMKILFIFTVWLQNFLKWW